MIQELVFWLPRHLHFLNRPSPISPSDMGCFAFPKSEAPALPKFPILESQGVYLQKIAPFYLYSNFKIQERTTKECSLIRAFVQEVEIQFALQRIQEVGQLYQKIPLPSSRSLSLLSFTPYAIAGLLFAASFFSEGIFHKGLHCIHNHVGMFAQTVSLIAAFALLYFGQWSLGGLTMGFMALGELQSRSIFPSRFWSVFNIAGSGLTLAFGSWMLRGLVLVDFCLSSLFQEMEERGPKKCELVEISPLKAIDEKRLRVNKNHIFYPISSNPDDFRDLLFQSLRNLRKKKVQELISSLKEQLPFLDSFLQEVEKDAFPFVFGLDEQARRG